MREKGVRLGHRTVGGYLDVRRRNARLRELTHDRGFQIDMRFIRPGRMVRYCVVESGSHLRTYLEALRGDARTHVRVNMRRLGAKGNHLSDGGRNDPTRCAAPSGMASAHDVRLQIGKEHSRTVRCTDAEQNVGRSGYQPITVGYMARSVHDVHRRAMDLTGGCQTIGLQTEQRGQAPSILTNRRGVIFRVQP